MFFVPKSVAVSDWPYSKISCSQRLTQNSGPFGKYFSAVIFLEIKNIIMFFFGKLSAYKWIGLRGAGAGLSTGLNLTKLTDSTTQIQPIGHDKFWVGFVCFVESIFVETFNYLSLSIYQIKHMLRSIYVFICQRLLLFLMVSLNMLYFN